MTTRMIRIDDAYAEKLEAFVAEHSDVMQIVPDENLEYDEYFYERKAHLQKTIDSIDDGSMTLLTESDYKNKMDSIKKSLL